MKKNAVLVMTARGFDRILTEGGSQAWVLNPGNAKKHEYLVTVQNRHNGAWGGASEPHGTAFLVGRISDVVPTTDKASDGNRYLIKISEYARVNVHHKWRGSNPVRYINLQEELDIDPEALDFHQMPGGSAPEDAEEEVSRLASTISSPEGTHPMTSEGPRLLTIPQAKAGLAAALGISPDKVEITIKA
jgi:hypothetical protein